MAAKCQGRKGTKLAETIKEFFVLKKFGLLQRKGNLYNKKYARFLLHLNI